MENRMKNRPDKDRHQQPSADSRSGIPNPHELLGIRAGETDAVIIIEAACVRLGAIRSSAGSETAVKRFLVAEIIAAREEMLDRLRNREDRETGHAAGRGGAECPG
jgi:hypothetical protein